MNTLARLVYDFLDHVIDCSYGCYEETDKNTKLKLFKDYARIDMDFYLFNLCYDIESNADPVLTMIECGKISKDLQPYIASYKEKYHDETLNNINCEADTFQQLAIFYDDLVCAACNEVMEKVWKNLGFSDIEKVFGSIPFTDNILDIIGKEIKKVVKDFEFFS